MLAIALINLKPGTAKTTSAVFLAASLQAAGYNTLLVDADPALSALAWVDLATKRANLPKAPIRVVPFPVATIRHQIVTVTEGSKINAVVIDTPQMEDHRDIVESAVRYVWEQGADGHAVVTVAPKEIEILRTATVWRRLDQIGVDGNRSVLLNRTNTRRRTKTGPDARFAKIMAKQGYRVLNSQIPDVDGTYSQTHGTWPPPVTVTPYPAVIEELTAA